MFTYKHYIETCNEYKRNDYSFCLPSFDVDNTKKQIYMFHDVDMKLENAENLAKVEYENCIKSTYFIRIGAGCYNIFNPYYKNIVKRIKKMNHTIGFHYENIFLGQDIEKEIKNNKDMLSRLLGFEVKYFNVHEPHRTGIDISNVLDKNNRCYNSLFFKNVKYLSDSGGRWREGCFSKHINKHKNLLVLAHPFLWYDKSPNENY